MTGQDVVLDLLAYLGVTGFSSGSGDRPGTDDDDIRRALAAINSSLQDIQKFGPQALKYGERAAFFNDPTSLVISVIAQQGQSATVSTVPPAWMLGCSILIDGDGDVNRIMDITGSDLSLLRGYRGSSSNNLGATVYADCALLSEEIGGVLPPVIGSPNFELLPADDLADFLRISGRFGCGNVHLETRKPDPGIPKRYYVERRRTGELFLRVAPMPGQRFNATFQAKLRAERIDESIIDTGGGGDPGYEFSSLHADEVESVLLPLARWKFFSHPDLKNSEPKQSVKDEYDRAMLTLTQGTTLDVSTHDNVVRYI